MVRVWNWTSSEYVNLHEEVWTRVFLGNEVGPCYTFDLSKLDKFKYVPVSSEIEFVLFENIIWQHMHLLVHTRFDSPDAYFLNGYLSITKRIRKAHMVELRKKIFKRESTRKLPCTKYERRTCQSIKDNESILKRFHCSIPVLYSGQHLDDVIPKGTANCSSKVTLEALDFIMKKESNCTISQTCESTRFTKSYQVEETWVENKALISVAFENPEVEYHQSYISYDLISLIGEVGGILGITLGASALTFFEYLFQGSPYF